MDLLGWGEWVAIGILAFLVIGPQDLPRVLHRLGKDLSRLRQMTAGLRSEFNGLMDLERQREEQHEEGATVLEFESHALEREKNLDPS